MTNEIEAKRKEHNIKPIDNYSKLCYEKGIDDGIKLAQKEFLNKLNTELRRKLNFNQHYATSNINGIMDFLIKELKQSLGVKDENQ